MAVELVGACGNVGTVIIVIDDGNVNAGMATAICPGVLNVKMGVVMLSILLSTRIATVFKVSPITAIPTGPGPVILLSDTM